MKNRFDALKTTWEITRNWQWIYPILGVFASFYSGIKLGFKLLESPHWLSVVVGIGLGLGIVKLCVFLIFKLESRWVVKQRWELIRIFIIFATTGSSSVLVGRPAIKYMGITPDHLNPIVYWILFVVTSLVIYQILLVFLGFVLGQFEFFWTFEKKMLRRFGLGRFLDK